MVAWCLLFLSKSGKLDLKIVQAFWCSIANNKLLNIQFSFSFILKSISEAILTSSNIFFFSVHPQFFPSILLLMYKNVDFSFSLLPLSFFPFFPSVFSLTPSPSPPLLIYILFVRRSAFKERSLKFHIRRP